MMRVIRAGDGGLKQHRYRMMKSGHQRGHILVGQSYEPCAWLLQRPSPSKDRLLLGQEAQETRGAWPHKQS